MKKSSLSVLSALGLILPVFTAEVVQQSSNPRLVPDYNRDGVINTLDYDREAAGEPFTVWLNDDDDAKGTNYGAELGDTNTDLHDVPGGEVNGLTREDFGSAILGFVKADGFSAIEVKNGEAKLDVVVGLSDSLGASAEWKPVSTNTIRSKSRRRASRASSSWPR